MQLVRGSDLVGLFDWLSNIWLLTEVSRIESLGCHCLRGRFGREHAKHCPKAIAAAILERIRSEGEQK